METLRTRIPSLDLLLPFGLDQFQHAELLFRDVPERDRQPDALCIQKPEAPSNEGAIRRIHRFFEQILGTAGAMADVDGLPIRAAGGAAIQLCLRRVTAPPATEDAVGTLFLSPAPTEGGSPPLRPAAGLGLCFCGLSAGQGGRWR